MAIEDYLPNVFGGAPTMYQGLLNPKDQAALQKRANLGGLLGFAGALAQGMSPQGYRRSALQNVLSALGAGYGGAAQTYESGINQLANVQKLQQSQSQMQAINQLLQDPRVANDPMMVAYIRANPAEAIKYFAEMAPFQQALTGAPSAAPAAPAPAAPAPVSAVPTMPEASITEVAPETNVLPGVTVTATPPKPDPLLARKQQLLGQIDRLSTIPTKIAEARIDTNLKQIKAIDEQISRRAVEEFDFAGVRAGVPDQFKLEVDDLQQLALAGGITGNDLRQGLQEINKRATEFITKEKDYTNEDRRVAAKMFPNKSIRELSSEEIGRLDDVLYNRDIQKKLAGRPQTTVNVADKVLAGERAKAQSRAEETAISAQSAASDVKAIVDILQPYRGGAWQDFAGQIGAYLPDTKAEQLATARQTAEAIRAKLAPTLRVEGSGATSDFEIKSFLSAIPSLFNTREGRQTLSTYAQRLADRSAAAADVRAELVEAGTFSIANFQKAMRERGLDRVFTPEDIKVLRGGVATESGTNMSPEGQKAFEKYRPR